MSQLCESSKVINNFTSQFRPQPVAYKYLILNTMMLIWLDEKRSINWYSGSGFTF